MSRPKIPFEPSPEHRAELQRLIRAPNTPKKLALRAHIGLLAAEGKDNKEIADTLGTSHVTVGLWRQRLLDMGLTGLQESPRPGRPKRLPTEQVQTVLSEVARPPKGQARWSCRTMARHSGLSRSAVQRIWAANGLKPHRTLTFKRSKDPQFEAKFWDVIGLYLDPPTRAIVLCFNEKSPSQALERTQPGLPLGQGDVTPRTHDYYRHGSVSLFAALNYLNGKILAERAPRHRHQEWLKFLKTIDSSTAPEIDLHLILGNYATHKHPKAMRWLAAHPRFHLHFTPTCASWLSLVERFFRDLNQDVILPGSFGSTNELVDAIWGYLVDQNLKPQRYQWQADGTAILGKIHRFREALERSQRIDKDNSKTLH